MALFTLTEFKAYAGITGTDDDVKLQAIVDEVNLTVKRYLGYNPEATDYTAELYDGPGTNSLKLNHFPIISVTTVTVYSDTLEAVTLAERCDGDEGYYIRDADAGILMNNDLWPRGRGVIEVTYRAGYATVPADLKRACYVIAQYYKNISKTPGVVSETMGSYSYTLSSGSEWPSGWHIPNEARTILDFYRDPMANLVY